MMAHQENEVHVRYRRSDEKNPPAGSEGQPSDPTTPAPRKKRRGIAVLPTLFTLGNCLCGFASMHYATRGATNSGTFSDVTALPDLPVISYYAIAGYLIFAAMLFDMFDGFVARLTKSASTFGAELDSLADMVSFGVAPAFLALKLIDSMLAGRYREPGTHGYWEFLGPNADNQLGSLFWIIGAVYVACTALRLARFNVMTKLDVDSHLAFRGLPSPGAAGVVASSIIFFEALFARRTVLWTPIAPEIAAALKTAFPYLMPVVLLIAALLMVSRFAYSHLINRFLRGRKRFSAVVWIFLVIMLLVWQPQITALVIIYIYAISAPLTWIWKLLTAWRKPTPKTSAT